MDERFAVGRNGRRRPDGADAGSDDPRHAGRLSDRRPGEPRFAHAGEGFGRDGGVGANGVPISADPAAALADCDVLIDFSTPATSVALCQRAAAAGVAHVIGTTGLWAEDLAAIQESAQKTAVVRSGNMSLGGQSSLRRSWSAPPGRSVRLGRRDRRNAPPHEGRRPPRGRRCSWVRRRHGGAGSVFPITALAGATGSRGRGSPATLVSRACAAARWWAITA